MTLTPTGAARLQRRTFSRAGARSSSALPIVGPLAALIALVAPAQATDLSADTSTATGGTSARTLAARAADVLNPLDFVAAGTNPEDVRTGVVDAAPAFKEAIKSRPVNSWVKIVVPAGTYKLGSDVTNDPYKDGKPRKVFIDLSSGALAGKNRGNMSLGPGNVDVTRVVFRTTAGIQTETIGTGVSAEGWKVGSSEIVFNNDGNAGYGRHFNYKNNNFGPGDNTDNGGDIADYIQAEWPNASGFSGFTSWRFGISPIISDAQASGKKFGLVGAEYNLAHRMPTSGWTEFDASKSGTDKGVPLFNSVGVQIVPDAWGGEGSDNPATYRKGGHMNIGFGTFPDFEDNKRTPAYRNGLYSPFHIGNNSTAAGGRGMYFGGDTTNISANFPYAGIEVRNNWPMFLNLEQANLTLGIIVNANAGQSYRWATDAGDVKLGANSAGQLTVAAPGGISLPAGVGLGTNAAGQLAITAPGGVAFPAKAWTSFVPTYTASGGSGVTVTPVTARYEIAGKTLRMRATMLVGYTGAPPTQIQVSTPNGLVLREAQVGAANNINSQAVLAAWSNETPYLAVTAGSSPIASANNQYVAVSFTGEIQ